MAQAVVPAPGFRTAARGRATHVHGAAPGPPGGGRGHRGPGSAAEPEAGPRGRPKGGAARRRLPPGSVRTGGPDPRPGRHAQKRLFRGNGMPKEFGPAVGIRQPGHDFFMRTIDLPPLRRTAEDSAAPVGGLCTRARSQRHAARLVQAVMDQPGPRGPLSTPPEGDGATRGVSFRRRHGPRVGRHLSEALRGRRGLARPRASN